TTRISLAGRYMVLMPGASRTGVSRKIDDEKARAELKAAAAKLDLPDGMGVIMRTAGRGRTKADLNRDLKYLLKLWDNIQKKNEKAQSPALIVKEQDGVIRALRDYLTPDFDEVVVDSDEAYDRASEYMQMVMPKQQHMLTRYVERRPIFHHYHIEEQLETIYASKVELPSGGSIVVEPTEALVSIDVNSGKQKHKGQEETALKTNLEAAKEVGRQLRLRDLGGIIVVDFIDMMGNKNQQMVVRALKKAVVDDKARIKIGRLSPNGTLELTRQRIRSALHKSIFQECPVCHGVGRIPNPESHAAAVLRKIIDRAARGDLRSAKVEVEPEAASILRTSKWSAVQAIEQRFGIKIEIEVAKKMGPGMAEYTFEADPTAQIVEIPEPDFGPPALPEDYLEDFEEDEEDELEEDEDDDAANDDTEVNGEDAQTHLGMPSFELIDIDDFRKSDRPKRQSRGRKPSSQQGNRSNQERSERNKDGNKDRKGPRKQYTQEEKEAHRKRSAEGRRRKQEQRAGQEGQSEERKSNRNRSSSRRRKPSTRAHEPQVAARQASKPAAKKSGLLGFIGKLFGKV
ncbi:Rne/Rng family ribonuclease, partial [Myxococcota bacterium]|nr:Rne/Rng family ribonuclease [Myxococcota bacterium]